MYTKSVVKKEKHQRKVLYWTVQITGYKLAKNNSPILSNTKMTVRLLYISNVFHLDIVHFQ